MQHIVILASGGGSNAARLIEHFHHLARQREAGQASPAQEQVAQVVAVVSDRRGAGVHARAAALGVPSEWVEPKTRRAQGGLLAVLRKQNPDLIVLAGYLQLVPSDVLAAYPQRVLNIHPALLPAYGGAGMYGQHVHAAVAADGAQYSGITIHLADEQYDRGRILFQATTPLDASWTAEQIAAAVLRLEHRHFPLVVEAYLRQL